jgi:nitrite reductase/ring-hydroxylating ferredoxin subunit
VVSGTVVCTLAELAATGSRGFRLGEGDWPLRGFVVRLADGSVRAWVNSCPHAGHPLDLSPHRFLNAAGTLIQCASHGALFAPDTGVCVAGPCPGRRLRSLPVVLQGDEVRLASDPADVDNARPADRPAVDEAAP